MTSEVSSFGNGRYQVLRKLGEGGKGIVFLCQDTALRRQVAIKVIKPNSF
jgi:serine/threonine protein kinase